MEHEVMLLKLFKNFGFRGYPILVGQKNFGVKKRTR